MPKTSVARLVLKEMTVEDLREFLDHHDLPVSGSKSDLIDRLLRHHDRDLVDLMEQGPWALSLWNDFGEDKFGSPRAKSYTALARSLTDATTDDGKVFAALAEHLEGWTVAEFLRDPDGFEVLLENDRVRDLLERAHGRTNMVTMLPDIRRVWDAAGPRTKAKSPATDSYVSMETSSDAPWSQTCSGPSVGERLGDNFRIVRRLGEGGFGAAYEVESERPRRLLVAKIAGRDQQHSLANEYEKARLFDHPNVCRVFALEKDARWGRFLVLQHGGRSVGSLVDASSGGVPLEVVKNIVTGAGAGLDYLHSVGVVHGDVNDGNVLLDSDGHVRLADFGISGFLTSAPTAAGVTRFATTARGHHKMFSAPEVHRMGRASPKSDQYSLGLVASLLLLGWHMFEEEPRAVLTRLPTPAKDALERALHPEAGARFQDCRTFAASFAAT